MTNIQKPWTLNIKNEQESGEPWKTWRPTTLNPESSANFNTLSPENRKNLESPEPPTLRAFKALNPNPENLPKIKYPEKPENYENLEPINLESPRNPGILHPEN